MVQDIKIRKAKPGDEIGVANLFKIGLERKEFLYTGTNKPKTKKEIKKMRKDYSQSNKFIFIAVNNQKKKIIGCSSFEFKKKGRISHVGEMGWIIHPDYQKKGIATVLLQTILSYAKKKALKRAEAEIAIENKASIKLAKKLGFKIEGRKKKAFLTDDGRYIDMYVVGKWL